MMTASGPTRPLSPSKARVARCVADGLSYPQIAEKLGLSTNTVQHYVHAIAETIQITELRTLKPYRRVQLWILRRTEGD